MVFISPLFTNMNFKKLKLINKKLRFNIKKNSKNLGILKKILIIGKNKIQNIRPMPSSNGQIVSLFYFFCNFFFLKYSFISPKCIFKLLFMKSNKLISTSCIAFSLLSIGIT